VDAYTKISFTTKIAGHGEFRTDTFDFTSAPEYGTIYPSWHLNLTTSFPIAQTMWTDKFQLQILARPSTTDAADDQELLAARTAGSINAEPKVVAGTARSIVQTNPHTEIMDEAFLASEDSTNLVDDNLTIDMSRLIFLPSSKWDEVVHHAQSNTLLVLLDDGGGRERWYCSLEFGLHLVKNRVLGRVNMNHPKYSMQFQETLDFNSAHANAFQVRERCYADAVTPVVFFCVWPRRLTTLWFFSFAQAFLDCLSCQREIDAVDQMRGKAAKIIEHSSQATAQVAHQEQILKELVRTGPGTTASASTCAHTPM